ncbi:MAG: DUF86 domain-containing protein [Ignavibacteriae bacterium]|nr:DUF86 domain-containing protein [Ignavibacteriota bacterium]
MSIDRDFIQYLNDMLESTSKGILFIKGLTINEFRKDEKTQFAVIRAIEIVGEASKKVPKEIKNNFSEIPWREISGMRDKLIHDYFGVNVDVVWKTAKKDLPTLKKLLAKIVKELDK